MVDFSDAFVSVFPFGKSNTLHDAVIIAGKKKQLQSLQFDSSLEKAFGGKVSPSTWKEASESIPSRGGVVPLHLNVHKLIALPDSCSRNCSAANAHVLVNHLRDMELPEQTKALQVIVVCDRSHSIALVSAVARAFVLFSRKTDFKPIQLSIELHGTDLPESELEVLSSLARAVRTAAALVDTPANELTTDAYVEKALLIGRMLGVEHTVIRGEELRERGFGGIYHVGKAGPTPPAFVVLSHKPKGAKETFALVGKGIIYDTGGLHLKIGHEMNSMKRDMGGSAALLGAFYTLVKSGFTQNLHVCLCIAENSISPTANKPDDVITLLSGKTLEITNTDCEGRIVLSDGVFYAKNTLKATHILDMATLTGAQPWMTGRTHAAVMCSREDMEGKAVRSGVHSGDLVFPMLYAPDMHFVDMRSSIADLNNCFWGTNESPRSVGAALFVGCHIDFGEDIDWVHVDMYGPGDHQGRSTGWGVAFTACLLGEHTNSSLLKEAQ